jgi:hypothetical protein
MQDSKNLNKLSQEMDLDLESILQELSEIGEDLLIEDEDFGDDSNDGFNELEDEDEPYHHHHGLDGENVLLLEIGNPDDELGAFEGDFDGGEEIYLNIEGHEDDHDDVFEDYEEDEEKYEDDLENDDDDLDFEEEVDEDEVYFDIDDHDDLDHFDDDEDEDWDDEDDEDDHDPFSVLNDEDFE